MEGWCHETSRQKDHATRNSPNFAEASHSTIGRYQQYCKPNNRPTHNRQWMHHGHPTSSLKPPQSLPDRSQTNRCNNPTASHDLPLQAMIYRWDTGGWTRVNEDGQGKTSLGNGGRGKRYKALPQRSENLSDPRLKVIP